MHVRVSLKSPTPEKFERITRFEKRGFFLQIRALEVLEENGISYHPAIMYELITSREEFERLLEYLVNINPDLPSRLEFEYLQVLPPLREKILWGIREGLIRPPKVG